MTNQLFQPSEVRNLFESPGPAAFIVPLDPEQIYYPKVMSKVLKTGKMESNPIHLMTPALQHDVLLKAYKYLPEEFRE